MLQIQFLDYNVIDALVPALTLKPEHLVFIYDQNKISEKYTENLTKALKAHLAGMNIAFVNADMYRISDIMDKIKKAVSEHAGEKVCIDITDTGKGIPKSHWKNVFSPGFTTIISPMPTSSGCTSITSAPLLT